MIGQQYPVQILTNIQAPAPVNFYNYADDTSLNSPITVQIFLNDLTISNRQIKLKTYFEGGNIQFQSNDFVLGAEQLFIDGGIPLILKNTELAPYYKYENIQGIGSATYGQSIPEGSYDFCFEVFDYLTGRKLSAKKCAKVFIFKNEPPLLNLPFNGSNIEPKDFENIVFQWTPRHLNVSNVEYELSIVEIWDNNVSPQTAFLSQIPIYQETTRATSFLYGADKPQLLPDKRYAWRIQAKALQGLEEIGLFKNEGYSEVFWFSRTSPCQVPEGISAESKGLTKINVYWNEDPIAYSDYIIAYREADKPDAYWFTKKTNSTWATIWNLKAGTTYEYKVKGKCTYQYSEYSDIQYVTTEIITNDDANYQCGIVPDAIAITNRDPHPGLIAGSQITAGDFKVVITEITNQSPGAISGNGYVSIPYLNFVKFAVNFSNILVNTDNQLAQGEIVTVYDAKFGEGASMEVDVNIDISEGINGDAGDTKVETVDFVIDSVTINADGAIVATGINADGEPDSAIIPGDKDVKVISSNGEVWSVGEDGTVTTTKKAEGGAIVAKNTNGVDADGDVTRITAKGVLVKFEKSGYYSYDALPENTSSELAAEYKSIDTPKEDKYKIPYKVISDNNGEDFIYANVKITDNTIVKDSVVFKTKEGGKVEVLSWNGNKAKLKLARKFHYADEAIYATIKNKEGKYDIAGALITTHLASQKLEAINVVLVPVGVDIDNDLIDKTKEIYAKAGVRLNIKIKPKVDKHLVYGLDNLPRIDVGDSNLLSHYTADEKLFNNYIKNQSYYNKKTYYVSVTNIATSDGNDLNGFMPLKRQFGFVFIHDKNNTSETQAKTLAHELGHGIFGLKHTWDEYKFPAGATDFLMDSKPEGTVLNHLDWKKLHAPGIQLYWFQGDEDGEYTTSEYFEKLLQQLRCASASGNNELAIPEKYREGLNNKFINFNYILSSDKTEINGEKINKARVTIPSGKTKISGILSPTIDASKGIIEFTNFKLKIPVYSYNWNSGVSPFEHFKNYLLPNNNGDITQDHNAVLNQLLNKDEFTNADISEIKKIANCGAKYFTTKNKYLIIKKITEHSYFLTEYYEDLILDLIDNYSGDIKTYSEELIGYFINDTNLTSKLFNRMTDEHGGYVWKGNENNYSRFLKQIYELWIGTGYAKESNYSYVETGDTLNSTILSPRVIMYDGDSWFPNVSYNGVSFRDGKVNMLTESIYGQHGVLSYELFQPVLIVFGKGKGKAKMTKEMVPAIYFAGTTEKDNLEKGLDQIGLTVDIALTFSGVGNFTKLRHLTKLKQVGRVIIGTVEITSGVADILMNYTDICEGSEEFCSSLQEYNMYLQMGLLGSGLIKTKFALARKKAKDNYIKNRDALIKKKGVDDPSIKELDEHFGLTNVSIDLSKFLDDELVKSFRKQVIDEKLFEKFPDLSIDELTAIKVYTSDEFINGTKIYAELNTQLRSGNLDDYYKGLNKLLDEGLGKMTPYNGTIVFRGCGDIESQIAKEWKKDDEIIFKDFKSSSTEEDIAESFMNQGGGDVIYEISNPKAYNICDISCSPNEAEIFFKSGSKFRVKKIEGLFIDIDKVGKKITLEYVE
ncbi:ADP-ribosyltransferase domain-containing protein [Tenacibaculum finnmarkense]|uniref:ADP-ribosyltransferase domain-containing protein n=2 Tax=Tenacibaculum finnmarkense TaxID=2781243 RepID=UPI001EFC229B|nr:ADP-ribosyltransferase domain-containing protein [Tenacibaculum finnmarkense]